MFVGLTQNAAGCDRGGGGGLPAGPLATVCAVIAFRNARTRIGRGCHRTGRLARLAARRHGKCHKAAGAVPSRGPRSRIPHETTYRPALPCVACVFRFHACVDRCSPGRAAGTGASGHASEAGRDRKSEHHCLRRCGGKMKRRAGGYGCRPVGAAPAFAAVQ